MRNPSGQESHALLRAARGLEGKPLRSPLPGWGVLALLLGVGGALVLGLSPVQAQDPGKGKRIYESHCAACHGVKGDGKGPAAATLDPRPTDFTSTEVMKDLTEERMYRSIRDGLPGTAMVAWGGILSDEEIQDVIAYIRTLAPPPATQP